MFINQQQTKGMKLTANPAWLSLPPNGGKGSGAKFLRIMKLTTILILAACLHTSAKGVAQQTITFSGKEVSLENVFNAIKKQTNYRFFFNTDMLQNASKVTLEVKNAQIEQVMNMALKDQPLTFTIKGRTIFIMKKPEEEKKSVQMAPTGDPITVSGRVTDENGEPLIGANVKVKGSSNGVTTDAQGRFTLNDVDPNSSLEISFVGRETQLLSVKGKTVFLVALGLKVGTLDETIVIAYGTTTKRLSTGNISSVKAKDIEKQPVNNPLLALQGRVPGLLITQNSGVPGGGVTVRIQGQNSMFGGNDPLYVIDGVPFISQTLSTATVGDILQNSGGSLYQSGGTGNPLSFINTNDIESIEVLKDADATSIYGSRAANGAILITTKKGKAGPTRLDVNMQYGTQKISRSMEMMNTAQYLEMRKEALSNDGLSPNPNSDYDLTLWDQSRNTNWVKTLTNKAAKYSNMNASVTGGNANVQYLIGATYRRETSTFSGDFHDRKIGVHFNINGISANQKFKVQLTGNFLTDRNRLPRIDLTSTAYFLAPNAPALYNEDGTLNWAPDANGNSSWTNPLASLLNKYQNVTDNLTSSAMLSYNFLPNLEVSSRFGYSKLHTDEFASSSILSARPESRAYFVRDAQYSNNSVTIFSVEPQVNYQKQWDKLKISALVGAAIQQNVSNGENVTGIGYATDELTKDMRSAAELTVNSILDAVYKYNAVFGTVNGNWRNKYIININARRDGSSHFGPANRFHNFASVGGAWIFSEENIFKRHLPFLSFGKIKTSYGTSGNDQVGDYTFMDLYTTLSTQVLYQRGPSIGVTSLHSPNLQWEQTNKLSVGIDLGFLHDRLIVNANFQRNRSSNQLMAYALPSIAGFQSVNRNFPATVQNNIWEFTLNTVNVKTRSIEWRTSFNLTIPKNKLLEFPNIETTSYASALAVGQPLNVMRAFHYAGVNANTGIYQFVNKNGDTTSTPTFDDRYVFLDVNPKFYGGLQSTFRFKNIEIDLLLQFVKKIGPSYGFGNVLPPGVVNFNQSVFVGDRWQKPGDDKQIEKYNSDYSLYDAFSNASQSDAGYVDASYIRLKTLSASYELPVNFVKRLRLQQCKAYIQCQNLLTITNYKGVDPETTSFTLPPMKAWTAGIQISL